MKRLVLLTVFVAIASSAQAPSAAPIGDWEGESVCQVPNPCTTEHVIYEIKQTDAEKITIKADKVVEGKREWMGDIDCRWSVKEQKLNCPMDGRRPAEWVFWLKGDRLLGELTLREGNVVYRKVDATRKK